MIEEEGEEGEEEAEGCALAGSRRGCFISLFCALFFSPVLTGDWERATDWDSWI
jgi:hypothetical protein